jgi:hypothetical protein
VRRKTPAAWEVAEGLIATVLEDGRLQLIVPAADLRLVYGQARTAMWIALRQYPGDVSGAAVSLATAWGVDPADVRTALVSWLAELSELGLIAVAGQTPCS